MAASGADGSPSSSPPARSPPRPPRGIDPSAIQTPLLQAAAKQWGFDVDVNILRDGNCLFVALSLAEDRGRTHQMLREDICDRLSEVFSQPEEQMRVLETNGVRDWKWKNYVEYMRYSGVPDRVPGNWGTYVEIVAWCTLHQRRAFVLTPVPQNQNADVSHIFIEIEPRGVPVAGAPIFLGLEGANHYVWLGHAPRTGVDAASPELLQKYHLEHEQTRHFFGVASHRDAVCAKVFPLGAGGPRTPVRKSAAAAAAAGCEEIKFISPMKKNSGREFQSSPATLEHCLLHHCKEFSIPKRALVQLLSTKDIKRDLSFVQGLDDDERIFFVVDHISWDEVPQKKVDDENNEIEFKPLMHCRASDQSRSTQDVPVVLGQGKTANGDVLYSHFLLHGETIIPPVYCDARRWGICNGVRSEDEAEDRSRTFADRALRALHDCPGGLVVTLDGEGRNVTHLLQAGVPSENIVVCEVNPEQAIVHRICFPGHVKKVFTPQTLLDAGTYSRSAHTRGDSDAEFYGFERLITDAVPGIAWTEVVALYADYSGALTTDPTVGIFPAIERLPNLRYLMIATSIVRGADATLKKKGNFDVNSLKSLGDGIRDRLNANVPKGQERDLRWFPDGQGDWQLDKNAWDRDAFWCYLFERPSAAPRRIAPPVDNDDDKLASAVAGMSLDSADARSSAGPSSS
eukprot:a518016_18.p1 GENE.a518016_18~~a518016_18.p1  ORF type:complete len:694 (+),score=11.58 a518016_18:31-2082(+)